MLRKPVAHLLPLALTALPLTAVAQDYQQRYDDCVSAAGVMNNASVAGCAESVSEAAKKDMNRVYQQLYRRLEQDAPEDARQLEEAQKAWLVYRNGQCDLQGKRIGSPMYYTCPMELNAQRVNELQFLLDNGG